MKNRWACLIALCLTLPVVLIVQPGQKTIAGVWVNKVTPKGSLATLTGLSLYALNGDFTNHGIQRTSPVPEIQAVRIIIPIVAFDQIYSFDRNSLIEAIPKPEQLSARAFAPAATELFDRIMQLADNAGGPEQHRALNYLAVRYPALYANAAEAFGRNLWPAAVETRVSPLSGTHKVLEVIFAITHHATGVTEKFFARVDVTEEFPFLVATWVHDLRHGKGMVSHLSGSSKLMSH